MSSNDNPEKESWIRASDGEQEAFEVEIYKGKKTNLLALKKNIVENITKQLDYYSESRQKLYKDSEMEDVVECPVCGESSDSTQHKVTIYGANYVQCNTCSHVYVIKRPSKKSINDFYLNDVTYATTYTDKKSAETRLNSIAVPWAKWMIALYEKKYGRKPKKVLDVGSGAGHFVEACRREGIEAYGIELSESSREFSRNIWGIELDGRDFNEVATEYEGADIVTFWGLLEHTPNPSQLLQRAYQITSRSQQGGMVISKLPRWDSLSSAIQRLSSDTIIRHLDPMGHIMAFTDASASEIYYRNKFVPVAAWYYGMDVYETLMQIGNKTGS
ncbi:MAG TPA: class I SAM-dependent methyltransferase, partial [Bacteroidales bacterium]|nr:class I SAM-dependent methyltransferase [Bacteroidales bacterium]